MSQRIKEFFAEFDMNHQSFFKYSPPDAAESAELMTGLAVRLVALGVGHVAGKEEVQAITVEVIDSILALRDEFSKAS
jgi:hypothetical protein